MADLTLALPVYEGARHKGVSILSNVLTGNACVLSSCRRYRYLLTRDLGRGAGRLVACLANPSYATHDTDDLTVSKMCGFGMRMGYRFIDLVNVCALRSTDPAGLSGAADPVGPENLWFVRHAARSADRLLVGFIRHPIIEAHVPATLRALRETGKPIYALRISEEDRHPHHPSRLPYSCAKDLVEYLPGAEAT